MFHPKSKQGEVIRFTKMHGIGNDYVYIDCLAGTPDNLPSLSRAMSDRHKGIGSDGIILIEPSEVADFKMRIFNADGSEARMCGNGSRCVAKFVSDKGLTASPEITLETLAGIKRIRIIKDPDGVATGATVDMGAPTFDCHEIGMTVDTDRMIEAPTLFDYKINAVGMGNPHGVIFLSADEFARLDIATVGPQLENLPIWTDRANIEFATVRPDGSIAMRVWERGSGETMACGTGACATAVAAAMTRRAARSVRVRLLGGDLDIEWRRADGHVMMTGEAATVFEGEYRRTDLPADTLQI